MSCDLTAYIYSLLIMLALKANSQFHYNQDSYYSIYGFTMLSIPIS